MKIVSLTLFVLSLSGMTKTYGTPLYHNDLLSLEISYNSYFI